MGGVEDLGGGEVGWDGLGLLKGRFEGREGVGGGWRIG